ncbi:MAG: fibro-slime domain-containing protein, partial [Clostridiales bacterium]|nr:fibro-slime domain-containing protein [Clostridiales bacterium]
MRRPLTNTDNLADHQVQGITPAGTTVNLFDYDPQIGSDDNDVLPNGTDATFMNHSNGINQGALLLFGGSAMREAGFWNQGSGAGRPWGKAHTNMKNIVKSTLENGYPYINLDDARKPLEGATGTASDTWPNGPFMDVANLNHAEYEGAGVSNARALSEKLLQSRSLQVGDDGTVSGSCEKASLQYLFDPAEKTGGKESYNNITGLFQIDSDGYYYYDARKNFAEFQKSTGASSKDGRPSDGSFVLYDGPAVWRTDAGYNFDTDAFDGDMSLGNFFPFDSASKVFDSIQTADEKGNATNILSSSEKITNVNNAVRANHYMGMTMQIDFIQPENGQLNMGSSGKRDMVFQFSGDDDVWVFIDNVLVLDLGGVHSELYGTINFSTGEVITGQSWRTGGLPDNPGSVTGDEKTTLYDMFVEALGQDEADAMYWVQNNGNKIFPTGTDHNLKMFYLERGNYDSSLQMRFNLQPSLYHSIKKVDQNGDALEGVEFELYAATANRADSADVADYEVKGGVIGTLRTGENGKTTFTRGDGSPFSFTDQYHADGTLYYILKEIKTVGGYRTLPKDIVLKFNPNTSMLIVANRYQTGAYASFFSNIRETGTITYGQFDTNTGVIASSNTELSSESKKGGLISAVPLLLESGMSHDGVPHDGKWLALYGSNTEGYGAVAPEERTAEAWRKAILKAALYQASDERWPEWRLVYNEDTMKLEGLLEDLPGRADRYALTNPNGDMKMVYGIIEPSALRKLGVEGSTSAELYNALEVYVSNAVKTGVADGKSFEAVIDEIVGKLTITGDDFSGRDFSFLNTDQFQREFRSTIYIPNERRELR